jgi:hypothetical protein
MSRDGEDGPERGGGVADVGGDELPVGVVDRTSGCDERGELVVVSVEPAMALAKMVGLAVTPRVPRLTMRARVPSRR